MTADVSSTSLHVPEAGKLVLPSYERPSGVHPPLDFEGYRSTALRHPKQPLVLLPHRLTEVTKSTRSTNERWLCLITTITSRHEAAISGAPPAPGSRTLGLR